MRGVRYIRRDTAWVDQEEYLERDTPIEGEYEYDVDPHPATLEVRFEATAYPLDILGWWGRKRGAVGESEERGG